MDICQSILANFYLRAAAGRYDRNEPWQLVALLTKIAQNKLATQARSEYRQPRDVQAVCRTPGPRNRQMPGGGSTAF
jgi:hypothetical protein